MLVRALEKGFYGLQIREPGTEFTLSEGDKLGKWMEPVDPVEQKAKEPKPAKPNKEPVKAAETASAGEVM